ncbi:xylose isomerase [Sediminicola sp. YIK13]|uniref:metabolite traffic protein EboE n=1 Tax=Sediminicola sp. YIK13 TaxID=1453352 RepID=UPI00071FF6F6|nr:metabolite traffic protein EboE [Sediminicola sp. YIK13]ALM06713.1 xylose isomerase [Sediminicola sp. YIK13]
MLIQDKFHVTYCSNIHPGEDWESTFRNLKDFIPKIKGELSKDSPFGIGLRLSNAASIQLDQGSNLEDFKNWLAQNNCYVFTMNGFPFGEFHKTQVKDKVHAPDWTTRERVDYTKRLFKQLAFLLPSGMSGGISTSPISYKHWYASKEQLAQALKTGSKHLTEVLLYLQELEKTTGKYLHLDIEPEPDGLLENTVEFVDFYENYLVPTANKEIVSRMGLNEQEAEQLTKRHITLCYDICHYSLAYEEPTFTFEQMRKVGITIGKIQVSSALKIIFEKGKEDQIWNSLARFNEPTYLHQVTEKKEGKVKVYNDLPMVLKNRKAHKELRAHFHVPIFLEKFDDLYSTQDQILSTLSYLEKHDVTEHLEVETYTWDVLPETLKVDLGQSIIRELKWLKEHMA